MQTLYDRLGEESFAKLTRVFYEQVSQDPILKPMYPEEDLGPAERRLRMFLEQYWGGPDTYQQERGHPRLRMRHFPFKIGPKAKQAWLDAMRKAVDSLQLSPMDDGELWSYLDRAAQAMQNSLED
uniref:globin n=1 Tax=Aquiluna sp. TaxID=2053504 RepID=UPI004047B69B